MSCVSLRPFFPLFSLGSFSPLFSAANRIVCFSLLFFFYFYFFPFEFSIWDFLLCLVSEIPSLTTIVYIFLFIFTSRITGNWNPTILPLPEGKRVTTDFVSLLDFDNWVPFIILSFSFVLSLFPPECVPQLTDDVYPVYSAPYRSLFTGDHLLLIV